MQACPGEYHAGLQRRDGARGTRLTRTIELILVIAETRFLQPQLL
jgi:hypothetical protein